MGKTHFSDISFYWPQDHESTLDYMNFQKKRCFCETAPCSLKSPPKIQKSHVFSTVPWCYFLDSYIDTIEIFPWLNWLSPNRGHEERPRAIYYGPKSAQEQAQSCGISKQPKQLIDGAPKYAPKYAYLTIFGIFGRVLGRVRYGQVGCP